MNIKNEFDEKCRDMIKRGEGCITHMYLDTVGKVTVGVGNMLPNSEAATELPFIVRDSGDVATDNEIITDFESVSDQEKEKLATSYKQFTKLDLPDNAIDELLDKRIANFESGLQRDFPDYDEYPEEVKLGLMDMAFNLGNSGLVNKFPTFTRAAREHDWEGCANECHRKDIADSRNQEVADLFSSATSQKLTLQLDH